MSKQTTATRAYRMLHWILTPHTQHNVLRTIFQTFYGFLCACINSGSQTVFPSSAIVQRPGNEASVVHAYSFDKYLHPQYLAGSNEPCITYFLFSYIYSFGSSI